jgi:hypothetical protein
MFDLLTKAFEALGPWPIVQFAAAALIFYVGLRAIQRGEKDKKPSANGEVTPRWFASEQQLELLRDIKENTRHSAQLLEQIANENVINPRRLQE